MSNLTEAQATYQAVYLQDFSWRQWRTRLVVDKDLQQPYRLKISFKEKSKDINISLESYKPN